MQDTLRRSPESCALVFFTPYRPWLLEKDLDFLRLAREGGFEVQKVLEKVMDNVLFENDRGVSETALNAYSCLMIADILSRMSFFGALSTDTN
jgi:predicted nicotinamide N-methyase